ncbi:MAG: putative toxin-antitoxin system toxin component, PIN family [Caldilineaceae bacterium]|nr:putative toxin-antitoxin system toxin component, PIN family [Caldilineaceae bacterium]MBP9074162.1 putative toxin-antitoxin system toxin component, PIN family [Caldilineaceae bacterium]
MTMLRFVLDTDVIIAAMRSPTGASAAILRAADMQQVRLLSSVPLVLEYEAKCTDPKHFQAATISAAAASNFVDAIAALCEPIELHFMWRPQLPDPNDEMVLETAINGQADAIVTFNLRHYGSVPSQFGIEVLLPSQAIWRIRS